MIKRTIALLMVFSILLGLTACGAKPQEAAASAAAAVTADASAAAETQTPPAAVQLSSMGSVCITKDGHRYETAAYRDDAGGDIYVSSSAMKTLFGENAANTVTVEQKPYENLTAMCTAKQVSSYAYDEVLNAVYIWSLLPDAPDTQGEAERIAHYGLGTPSDDEITYQAFFAAMDKAVETVDASKLPAWQKLYTSLRNSQDTLTRCEAMVAMLRLALALGGEYPEFNDVQYTVQDAIGEAIWPQIDEIANAQQEKGNPLFDANFPYDLGGFEKSPEVYEWGMTGVAYNYILMRKSNVSGNILLDYDKSGNSLHLDSALTVRDALSAVTRLLDSSEAVSETADFVSPDDSRITNCSAVFLPESLTEQSLDIVNPFDGGAVKPFGAVLTDYREITKDPLDLSYAQENIRRDANFGFNTVRYMIPYYKLFTDDVSQASIELFEQLDQVIATALEYKIHLNLVLTQLPGHWYREGEDYSYYGEFDLFLNAQQQEKAKTVWRTIAERYKDVPTNALSFGLWEIMNQNMSSGLPSEPYTVQDAAYVCADLIQTVGGVTPDRLVTYEVQTMELADSAQAKEIIESRCDNGVFSLNYSDMPFVYANMTAVEGEHIDNCNKSMFQSLYPVTYYDAQWCVANDAPLILQGDLPKGTEVKLYLDRTYDAGKLTAYADDEPLYEEQLPGNMQYAVTNKLSVYVQYAESNKCITFTLPADAKEVRLTFPGYCVWAGMAVTLPEDYAVKRWFTPSLYESYQENGEKDYSRLPYEKETSTILISPTVEDPTVITIHSDISYSTELIAEQSNAQTIDAWFKQASERYPNAVVRSECADFSGEFNSQVLYVDDVMASAQKYGMGFFTNDFNYNNYVFVDHDYALKQFMAGSRNNVPYENGWLRMDMFKVYEKYLPKTVIE